jgi:hypothetical protein
MEKAVYFIAFAWTNMQNSISFGNCSTEDFPLKWLKEMQDHSPNRQIRLLWWKKLTNEDEIKAAKSIGTTSI